MTQAFNLSQFANKLNTSGQTDNTGLQNSSVTVTAGTGMSGGGAVALGSSVTLTNAGVTSVAAGTGISVSASTGAVTISSSGGGVTSLNGNTGALKGMDLISTGTISSSVTSFDISSIPSGYQILKLYVLGRSTGAVSTPFAGLRVSTNSGSTFATSNYSWSHIYNGTGGGAGASDSTLDTGSVYGGTSIRPFWLGWGAPANQYFITSADLIQSVGSVPFSTTFIGGTSGSGSDGSYVATAFGQYNSTTYINGLRIIMLNGGNFGGGAWTLYGIKNA
jgi:hypothetical protein